MASKTAERKTAKTEEKITSLQSEKEELESEMLKMNDAKKEIEAVASEVLEKLEAATVSPAIIN